MDRRTFIKLAAAAAAPLGTAEEVPYVQTPQPVVDAMLELAAVRGSDFLIDLGSGDGRIVITAAMKYGASGLGIDYDPRLVKLGSENAALAGVDDRVRFVQEDFFRSDLSAATVVTMYLLPDFNLRLRPKFLAELRPGTRIVSHDGGMGDWAPDASITVPAPDKPVGVRKESDVALWIVPAQLGGRWRSRIPTETGAIEVELAFLQTFQQLAGTARVDGAALPIERSTVRGRYVAFRIQRAEGDIRFQGHVGADRIAGQAALSDGRTYPWRALRIK